MNNLIKINQSDIGGASVQTVNARSLHEFLEVKSEFRNWIKNRIDDFEFRENQDFATTVEIYRGGERRDYHLSLDMAKELSMVERNAKGKEARQYFIECERLAKESPSLNPANLSRLQLIQIAMEAEQEKLALEVVIADQAPKVDAHDRIAEAAGTLCIRDAAKTLQVQPSKLTHWLVTNKWIYHRVGKSGHLAYQDKIQAGYLTHKCTPYVDSVTGDDKISEQIRITGKGITILAKRINEQVILIDGASSKKPALNGAHSMQSTLAN